MIDPARVEAVARALCAFVDDDPDSRDEWRGGKKWLRFIEQAEVCIRALDAHDAGRKADEDQ